MFSSNSRHHTGRKQKQPATEPIETKQSKQQRALRKKHELRTCDVFADHKGNQTRTINRLKRLNYERKQLRKYLPIFHISMFKLNNNASNQPSGDISEINDF